MFRFALIAGALFATSFVASKLGMTALGAALFPIPVFGCMMRRQVGRAMCLLACAALAMMLSGVGLIETFLCVTAAGMGVPLGLGVTRRWTYGQTVTAVACVLYFALATNFVFHWSDWVAQSRYGLDLLHTQWKTAQSGANGDSAAAMAEIVTWVKDKWENIGLGLWLWPVLVVTCMSVSYLSSQARRRCYGEGGLRGSFREMRVSEWLIWAAIATAVLCLADYRKPEFGLRIVSWNAAFALAAIYWLNGLSIFAFTLDMFKTHFLLVVSCVFLFVLFMPHPLLCMVGMFDTWINFRDKLVRLAAAIKERENSDDSE
jgi:hypothetical protein